ncbi:Carbohydrate degrading enzyme [Entamoeba marina]
MVIAETSQPKTIWSYRNKCPSKVVCLTFDDSPSPSTREFVKILNETNSTATFFFLGKRLEYNYQTGHPFPLTIRRLLQCGNDTDAYLGDRYFVNNRKKWLRPASGISSNFMHPIANQYNYTLVAGSIHSFDRQLRSTLINLVNIVPRIHSGDIIILHDLPYNIPLVKNLIQQLHKDGYKIMSLSDIDALCTL